MTPPSLLESLALAALVSGVALVVLGRVLRCAPETDDTDEAGA